ncbi:MAG TPA: aromatic aminobenezylarsenical efflux permease ArsG family transporter [Candidatus Sulfotelmatobacter sp.]|nr:aromatic aminobenezylarsenical efflux permease ArsG family transporter [Candidatus Sulfotelmatobacter sp.]
MDDFWVGVTSATWLGVLTSISPCPLATNIAAISYIGKQADRPRTVLLTGSMYTLGRALTYVILGALLVASLLSVPGLSNFLQHYMNKVLGPVLVLVGMSLLDLLRLPGLRGLGASYLGERLAQSGAWGAGLLGMMFALSFCPTSAALFFGSLIPLSIKWQSSVVLPSLYGAGTALPVFAFAVLIAMGAKSLGAAFQRLTAVELWARRITGVVFILIGIYFSVTYIFHFSNS